MDWPDELILDLARKRCVVFLGSGISANSKDEAGNHPPTWGKFLNEGNKMVIGPTHDAVQTYIERYQYLMACELIRRQIGKDKFEALLKSQFNGNGFDPAPIHHHIFKLDSRITITPNFDKIYDTLAQSKSRNTIAIKYYYDKDIAKSIRNVESVIIKNHGTIDFPDRIVFSQADYARVRIENSDFYKIMESLILTHTFLFLGAGLNDPDIRLLFENYAMTFNLSKNHYFVIPDGSYSDLELEVIKESMHLDFVKYNNPDGSHIELTAGLQSLATMVEKKKEFVRDKLWW